MLLILNIIGKRRQACKQRIEVVKPRKITWKSRENHRHVRDKKDMAWQTSNPYQAPVGSILSTRGTYFVWAEASFSTLHEDESKVRLQLSLFLSTGREKKHRLVFAARGDNWVTELCPQVCKHSRFRDFL